MQQAQFPEGFVWGAATAAYIQELLLARDTMMRSDEDKDAPQEGRDGPSRRAG